MVQETANSYFKYILIYATTFTMVTALNLSSINQITTKPRHTKFTSSTTEPGSGSLVTPSSTDSQEKDDDRVYIYRYNGNSDTTCILLKTDGVVEINYLLYNNMEQVDSFIPDPAIDKAKVSGSCIDEDNSFLNITWEGHSLLLNFAKTPGGERWYIEKVELSIESDLKHFHSIKTSGQRMKLYHNEMLIPTPVGKSYSCPLVEIDLKPDKDEHPPAGLHGTLILRLLQLQPFMYKSHDFEAAFECKPQKFYRDETAPIAVGSTLAIAVLMTVTGYGIFRYFKIKNVQYNTME